MSCYNSAVKALVGIGAVSNKILVNHQIELHRSTSERTRRTLVKVDGAPMFLVKEAKPGCENWLHREASSYKKIRRLLSLTPQSRWSGDPQALVIDWVNGNSLLEYAYQHPQQFPALFVHLGTLLKNFHESELTASSPFALPWILAMDKNTHAYLDVIEDETNTTLDRKKLVDIADLWNPTSFIHGDLKFDNMIVDVADIRLIDWELGSVGDVAWDIATVLQEYFLYAGQLHASNIHPTEVWQNKCVSAFFNAYGFETELSCRVMKFTAIRLVQAAIELSNIGDQKTMKWAIIGCQYLLNQTYASMPWGQSA